MAAHPTGPASGPQGDAILQAASRILSALIRNGRLTNGNHTSLVRSAIVMAMDLARETERALSGAPGETTAEDVLDLLDE
jgi:hypothetical protein